MWVLENGTRHFRLKVPSVHQVQVLAAVVENFESFN